jgi:hypothetical protein
LIALAVPHALKELDESAAKKQTIADKKDTLLKTSKVIGLRAVPLRMEPDGSIQSLHTDQADSIPVIEINLGHLESTGDSSSSHIFPRKFLNCLIPNREEFRGVHIAIYRREFQP